MPHTKLVPAPVASQGIVGGCECGDVQAHVGLTFLCWRQIQGELHEIMWFGTEKEQKKTHVTCASRLD